MKRLKMGLLACLVVACMSLVLAGCQQTEYTPEAKDPAVSGSSLGVAGKLRVGISADTVPMAGQLSDGSGNSRYDGIDVYVAYALGDELGLQVELVNVDKDFSQALSDGDVDIVLGVDASADDVDFWCSAPYIQKGYALFGMSSETVIPTVDSSPKIAAQGSKMSSWLVVNLYGDDSLVSADSLVNAFELLNAGSDSARYVAADALAGLYTINNHGYQNKIVALLEEPSGYCVGVAEGNTDLQNAVTAAVNNLVSGGMMNIIEQKFLGTTVDLSGYTVVKSPTAEAAKANDEAASDEADGEEGAEAEEGVAEEESAAEGEAVEEAPQEEPAV